MNVPSVFVETDIIAAFLVREEDGTSLLSALQKYRVYTSFIQVAEILEVSDHPSYVAAAMDVLSMIRPLGAHPRYSPAIAAYSRLVVDVEPALRLRMAICAAISTASKLPVLTVRHESVYLRLDIPTIKPESRR